MVLGSKIHSLFLFLSPLHSLPPTPKPAPISQAVPKFHLLNLSSFLLPLIQVLFKLPAWMIAPALTRSQLCLSHCPSHLASIGKTHLSPSCQIPQLLPRTQGWVSMFSHMTFKALPDVPSTDLCYLIFSVVMLTHTVAQQQQIGYCPLCTRVFPIPTSALPLLTSFRLGHSPSTSSWSTRPFLQCSAQMVLNLQNSLNCTSHRKPSSSTNM